MGHGHDMDDLITRAWRLIERHDAEPDPAGDDEVRAVLAEFRKRLRMQVLFVAEFTHGRRVLRFVDQEAGGPGVGIADDLALEACWCQRVADGRLPELVRDAQALPEGGAWPGTPYPVGAYLGTPIRLADHSIYGALCCFMASHAYLHPRDLQMLRTFAAMVASRIDRGGEAAARVWRPGPSASGWRPGIA